MTNKKLLSAAALLSMLATPAASQTSRADPSDMQSWHSTGIKLDLPNGWESSLRYRLRLVDNSSSYRGSYLSGGIGHSPVKRFSLLGDYRLALVDEGTFHRFRFGAEGSGKVASSTVSLRPMLQYQRQNFADHDDQGSDEEVFLRTRLKLEQRIGKSVEVYGSAEPYFTFAGGYPIDNWRNTVGLEFEYAKGKKLDLFYTYRPDYAKGYNRTFHILGVDFEFDMKLGGKKKKK